MNIKIKNKKKHQLPDLLAPKLVQESILVKVSLPFKRFLLYPSHRNLASQSRPSQQQNFPQQMMLNSTSLSAKLNLNNPQTKTKTYILMHLKSTLKQLELDFQNSVIPTRFSLLNNQQSQIFKTNLKLSFKHTTIQPTKQV